MARLARTRFLRKQHDALLDPEELSVVWGCLKESISGPDDDPAKDRINYDDFCQVGERCAAPRACRAPVGETTICGASARCTVERQHVSG